MRKLSGMQPKSHYNINGWELPEGEILAPMAGISDSPYRQITRRFGSGLLYSECISAEGVRRLGKVSLDLANFHEVERPYAVQLFGSDPDQFGDAAAIIAERLNPDMIDINCGCPVKRFVTRCSGGYLMQYPDLIGRIVEKVRETSKLPVSVKLRTGYRRPEATACEAAVIAEEAGASLVAVHGRYVRGAKGSDADWEVIGSVKQAVRSIPVIGNGDVFIRDDVDRMMKMTGCDRVMIARGAEGRPWIFDSNGGGAVSNRDRIRTLLDHYRLMLADFPERTTVNRMRKHIGWYTRGMRGSAALRFSAMRIDNSADVIELLENYTAEIDSVE